MTSILRTWYTFRINRSEDVSYNLTLLGLWTWAETTIGTLVACLPVLPRFVQHIWPKILSLVSIDYKLRQNVYTASTRNTSYPLGSGLIRRDIEGGESLDMWSDSSGPLARIGSNYTALDDPGARQPLSDIELPQLPTKSLDRRHAGLEDGRQPV